MATDVDYGRKWGDPVPVVPPHPAPEVTRRTATPEEIPAGARQVMKKATAAGWSVVATYARGHSVDNYGHAKVLTHSLAVRLRLPGTQYRAVAVWTAPAELSPEEAKWTSDAVFVWVVGSGVPVREVPLRPGRKDPDALSLAVYLVNPERLTITLTEC
jgi:hypothetical protein